MRSLLRHSEADLRQIAGVKRKKALIRIASNQGFFKLDVTSAIAYGRNRRHRHDYHRRRRHRCVPSSDALR
jgi:hypothetical protein